MSNRLEIIGVLEGGNEIYARDKGRVMSGDGVCMTLEARDYKDPPRILVKVKHDKPH